MYTYDFQLKTIMFQIVSLIRIEILQVKNWENNEE